MSSEAELRQRGYQQPRGDCDDDFDFTNDDYSRLQQSKARRRRKHRRDYSDDDDDDYDKKNEGILPRWKLCLVIGSIFVCFALLFPTVFSPMLNSLLGRGTPANNGVKRDPRPMNERVPPPSRGGQPLHPAASAHMRMPESATTQPTSGRGGMIGWMMPIYTIGVVAFLGYTLYKIMFRKKKKRRSHYYDDCSDDSDSDTRAGGLGRRKMRGVQQRLQKTEEAMRQILEQLETIAHVANNTQAPQNQTEEKSNDVQKTSTAKNNENIHLNEKQVMEVEESLRELKKLSELYKQQQEEISGQDESEEEFDDSGQTLSSSSGEDDSDNEAYDNLDSAAPCEPKAEDKNCYFVEQNQVETNKENVENAIVNNREETETNNNEPVEEDKGTENILITVSDNEPNQKKSKRVRRRLIRE